MSYFDDFVEPYILGDPSDWLDDKGKPIPSGVICDLLGGIDPIDGSILTAKKVSKHLKRN